MVLWARDLSDGSGRLYVSEGEYLLQIEDSEVCLGRSEEELAQTDGLLGRVAKRLREGTLPKPGIMLVLNGGADGLCASVGRTALAGKGHCWVRLHRRGQGPGVVAATSLEELEEVIGLVALAATDEY